MQMDWDIEADGCGSGAGASSVRPAAGATHVMAVSPKRTARVVAEVK
jgi:hypothetical protein